ncbi:MAG: LysR family transcriptional regulator [Betaproteobacteria bacterium]|nr:LysR family transcriptional regulator [Betaproteobacteria bacterium]
MAKRCGHRLRMSATGLALAALGLGWQGVYAAEKEAGIGGAEENFHLGGYARGWVSMNLQDIPETAGDDRYKPSMIRGSVLLDADLKTGPAKWKAIARLDREYKTSYLKDLEALRATTGTLGGDDPNIMDNYNQAELREAYVDFNPTDRLSIRLGKQQIVWGESDFFHAMDLVHGYDLSWRLFFEGENEEWRKPLVLMSARLQVPEAKGQIHGYIRPGLDPCKDIGNTYDIRGGRWFFQPYRGFDLTAFTAKDCEHPDGDYRDVTGGIRWSAEAGPVNYSVAYLRTFSADPVANSAFAPFLKAPAGPVFDLIHPKIDVLGATVSGYSAGLDAVLSAEAAYIKDQPFNVGQGPLLAPTQGAAAGLGLGGIKKKNVLSTMLRADKNLHFERVLGTNRPSLSSVQLFDTWVLNHKDSDDLVRLFAYGSPLKEHSTILTAWTVLNYKGDTINPGLAVGFDLTNGGGFLIPSVDFVFGDKWRLKVEADIFWRKGAASVPFDPNPNVQLFGYFANNSQLVARLTRLF